MQKINMNSKKEKGIAIIMMLLLTAILMISLSTAVATLCALRKQNKLAKKGLSKYESQINVNRK